VRDVYVRHGQFIWRSLQRLGVAELDLDDCLQEVLLVVHRRRDSYDPARAKLTTWLFGICLRIAKRHHRRVRKRSASRLPPADEPVTRDTPEDELAKQQARRQLQRILDSMDLEKRATFVLFELEAVKADAIAELMGVPVGTVHSRLHAARKQFVCKLRQEQARSRRQHG
jgi:RNA polymerase sigma-70 factor (ECF subfamily)